jgi:dihydroorotase
VETQVSDSNLLVRGARIIDPDQGLDIVGSVIIENGRILAIGEISEVNSLYDKLVKAGKEIELIDLPDNWIIAPGFIDLHAHFRDSGFASNETLTSGTEAATHGGFTTTCTLPDSQPPLDQQIAVKYILEKSETLSARVKPIAALTKGRDGKELTEMVELAEAGAIAFSDGDKAIRDNNVMRLALQYAKPLDLPIIGYCQDESIMMGGVMNEGPIALKLGLRGWPSNSEEIMLSRDLSLVRSIGTKYHASHISTAKALDIIREAKRAGLPVTAEVSPYHLLLTDEWVDGKRTGPLADALLHQGISIPQGHRYDTNAKVNPPLRTMADCIALLEGVLDGTIDAIVSSHEPHTVTDKECEFDKAAFGISGLETCLALLLTLVQDGKLPLPTLIAALTTRPAKAMGISGGTLRKGQIADITIFDPTELWTVNPQSFLSLGQNTPLTGILLRGRVRMTILGGKVVYKATTND